jgi:agmatine deiminase
MKPYFALCILYICFGSLSLNAQRVPAEWEPQHGTILTWFEKDVAKGISVDSVHLEMTKSLVKNNNLIINVKNDKHKNHIISILTKNDVAIDKITFRNSKSNFGLYNYPRDFGPEWLYDAQQNLSVVDMNWSFYGYLAGRGMLKKYLNNSVNQYDKQMANELGINIAATSTIISEGGAKEFNGEGVLMVVEQTELNRNPDYSKGDLEKAYKQLFNLKKIIWLPYPTYDDEHMFSNLLEDEKGAKIVLRSASANGHIDEFCRFVDTNTILLAEVTEEEAQKSLLHRINKDRLDASFQLLKNETDANGKPFTILRIPVPEVQFFNAARDEEVIRQVNSLKKLFKARQLQDGTDFPHPDNLKLLPALSYCNFTIANGVVLVANYWQKGLPESIKQKDKQAVEILSKVFPNRKIVQINPLAINFSGGGLHCNTRHIPSLKK